MTRIEIGTVEDIEIFRFVMVLPSVIDDMPVYELLVGLWTTLINNVCPSIKNTSYFSAYDEDVLE